jgi:hypothetical protein
MGQYYKSVFISENNKPISSVSSYDFGTGAKLMEHSWMKNPFVRFVEKQLMITPQRLVWSGDYADNEDPSTLTQMEIKALADETCQYTNSNVIKDKGVNLYTLAEIVGKLTHDENVKDKYKHDYKNVAPLNARYLINHDKKQFVDKTKTPRDADGWQVHPLPLLTCDGNGRGGGDFRGDSSLVGVWARNLISVTTRKSDIPKGFEELIFDIKE